MVQDIKKDGQSELRRSMVLRCQRNKIFHIIAFGCPFPGFTYDGSFVLESKAQRGSRGNQT